MPAGRCFFISPPTEGSKFTHYTSPRFIAGISNYSFRPFKSFCFVLFILGHLLVIPAQPKGK